MVTPVPWHVWRGLTAQDIIDIFLAMYAQSLPEGSVLRQNGRVYPETLSLQIFATNRGRTIGVKVGVGGVSSPRFVDGKLDDPIENLVQLAIGGGDSEKEDEPVRFTL